MTEDKKAGGENLLDPEENSAEEDAKEQESSDLYQANVDPTSEASEVYVHEPDVIRARKV